MDASGNNPIKLAVLYICTGKYSRFFADFYESAKRYLLKDEAKVTYFVFTDDRQLSDAKDVKLIEKRCEGFPKDTLMRFEMFMGIREQLEDFDYICFFNSNALLKSEVGREILPQNEGMKAVRWIGQKPCDWAMFYPYERNRRSRAYIMPFDGPYAYYMGGFYCGKAPAFLAMTEELAQAIREDEQQGIMARFHDESHVNRYLHEHPHEELPKGYCCAEERLSEAFETKVVFRNKRVLDDLFCKNEKRSLWGRLTKGSKMLATALKWYL